MSLASAMSTALTGLSAAETQISVVGNNLANSNTVGFKASDVLFATQFLQTQSVGSAPTANSGGNNPVQEGLGVQVAEITPNFSQGTISNANSPTDLAIQGDGFFIVQGNDGSQQYTRNGTFTTNGQNELVTGTGNRVLGYGIDNGFQINTTHLQALQIPLGSAMVAKATTKAVLQGALTPTGDIANTAGILQSGVLTDDSMSKPQSGPTATITLDNSGQPVAGALNGTYNYYVEFTSNNNTSRPQLLPVSTQLLVNNQISLTNLPTSPAGDTSGWTGINIYRSVNIPGNTNYYLIDSESLSALPASVPDDIADTNLINNAKMSFYGPPATNTTLLADVVVYDPSTSSYNKAFSQSGTLQFTGNKGGNSLTTQSMAVSDTTTLKDLANFLQGSLGIQSPPGNDPAHPIPNDSGSSQAPGVTITSDGKINIVSNDGVANSVSIPLSALQLIPTGDSANTTAVNIPFNSTQAAKGQGVTADMTAYDSLGIALPVTITAVLEASTSNYTEYRWYADCGQNDPGNGQTNIAVGTGIVQFDGQGNLIAGSDQMVSIGRAQEPSVKPLQFKLDFDQVSGLASPTATLSVSSQDGSAPGVLSSFNISNNGLISGVFSNGISRDLGQILLARFSNPIGLEQQGQNMYAAGVNSGLPIIANPGDQGSGTIAAGSLELSNSDIGASLINLITTQTMYSSNTRVITTAQNMFNDLLQLLR